MSTIERLNELAKGAHVGLIQLDSFTSKCTPAAIAQAHAEYAELGRKNAELVEQNAWMKELLSASSDYVSEIAEQAEKDAASDVNGSAMTNIAAGLLANIHKALAHSAQEKADAAE